jgi:pimeloyl-ACP methyl ester carboxylesterase
MPSFILIPGAGGIAWYWHRLTPILEAAGHDAIAVDLPGDNPQAGLSAYADRVVAAIGSRPHPILVAQSLGGFTAPLVCERVRIDRLILVNAMIPNPGETAGAWGENTGSGVARKARARLCGYDEDFDLDTYFWHDVPADIVAQGAAHERDEAEAIFAEPCAFERWPDIPIHVIAGRDDRLFPIDLQRRIARERLQVDVDEVPGGHLVALSQPQALAGRILSYLPGR